LGQFVNPGTRLGVVFATDFAEVRLPLTDADLAFVDLPDTSDVTSTGSAEGPAVVLTAIQKGKPVDWAASIVRTEGVVDEKSRVDRGGCGRKEPGDLCGCASYRSVSLARGRRRVACGDICQRGY
jgi:hypothetical protein